MSSGWLAEWTGCWVDRSVTSAGCCLWIWGTNIILGSFGLISCLDFFVGTDVDSSDSKP